MATLTAYLPATAAAAAAPAIEVLRRRASGGGGGGEPSYGPPRREARLRCRQIRLAGGVDGGGEAVLDGVPPLGGELRVEDVGMLKIDDLLRIDRVRLGRRTTLFEGFLVAPGISWDAGHEAVGYRIAGFETRLDDALIVGQVQRPPTWEAGIRYGPDGWVHATALAARFNPRGAPNAVDAGWADADGTLPIPLFAAEGDADAVHWTAAAAVAYLLYTSNRQQRWIGNPSLGHLAEVFSDAQIGDLVVEQMSLAAALRQICRRTGRGFRVSPRPQAEGAHALRFYRLGSGRGRAPRLNVAGSNVLSAPASDALAGRVEWDVTPAVNTVTGLGGVRLIEATFQASPDEETDLVMGWFDPDVDLADHLDGATVNELDADLHEMLDARGERFDRHRDTLRLWVLNEDGAFTAEPFDMGEPYDFTELFGTAAHVRRRRPFQQPLALLPEGRRRPIACQISYDSGETWYPLEAFEASADRAGIRITAEDLFALCPTPGDGEQAAPQTNYVQAFYDLTLRLRVTASIETDQRLAVTVGPAADGPTRFPRHRAFEAGDECGAAAVDADSVFAGDPAAARDDAARLAADAEARRDAADVADVTATHELVGLRTDLRIGDCLVALAGRGVNYHARRGEGRYPQITRIEMDPLERMTTTVTTRSHREELP
jgi:hypothetical protein